MEVTSQALDAGLLQFSAGRGDRHGRVPRDAEPAHQRRAPSRRSSRPSDLAQVAIARRGGRAAAHRRRGKRRLRPAAADRRRGRQRRPGPAARRREAPGREHARGHRGRRGRAEGPASRPAGRARSTRRSSARRASSRSRSTTSRSRCCSAACSSMLVLIAFLFEWRAAFISLVAIPLSLVAAGVVLTLRGRDDQHDDPRRVRGGGRRGRRRRDHRHGEHRPAHAAARAPPAARAAACDHPARASLEVRGAIFYATLINVVAVVPVAVRRRPDRRVLPAARAVLRAGGARLDGRRADRDARAEPDPAARAAALRAPRAAARARAQARLRRGPGARDPAPGARRSSTVAAVLLHGRRGPPAAGRGAVPGVQGARLPHALDHRAGHVDPRGAADRRRGRARSCAPSRRRARLRLAHRPGVPRRGDRGVELRRELGQRRPEGRLRQDASRRLHEVADLHPGLYRNVQTYLRERIDEVLVGESEPIVVRVFGDDLGRPAAHRGPDQHVARRRPRHGGAAHLAAGRGARRSTCASSSASPAATASSPATCAAPPATLVAGEEVGDMFQGGVSTNVMVWSMPTHAQQPDGDPQPADRHADATGRSRSPRSPTSRIRPTPNVIQRENASRRIDVAADLPKGRDLGAVTHDIQERLRPHEAPARLPRGAARRGGRAPERAAPPADLRDRRGARRSSCCCRRRSAAGGSPRCCSSRSRWRSSAGSWPRTPASGSISLGALIGFYTVMGIAARNGIMMITPLPAPRAPRGRAVRPGARACAAPGERLSPILMTALATGLALLPLVAVGRQARAGDRAPDGRS